MPRFPLPDWLAEQFRLTIFPQLGDATRSREWWQSVVGAPPDETSSSPKKGTASIAGPFGDGKLVLKLEPERIDWLLIPSDREPGELLAGSDVPTIGRATETLPRFAEIAERWLAQPDVPAVARMAFGAVLTHIEPDRRSGYLRLPDYVPVQVDPDSSDFLYQINLPVQSRTGVDGLRMNRLSKWSVLWYRVLSVNVLAETAQHLVNPVFAFRLELDINTSLETGAIPRERLIDVFHEQVDLGFKIAELGVANR